MSNYVKAVDYSAKDALASGNPNKIIKGTELNDEFNAIATAVGTKADSASPVFLGNPTATTQTFGNNSTRLATTAFVQTALQALYPVGTIYTSVSPTNPNTLFGFGTWVAFASGKTLIGVDSSDTLFDTVEETGGNKDAVVVAHTHPSENLTGSFEIRRRQGPTSTPTSSIAVALGDVTISEGTLVSGTFGADTNGVESRYQKVNMDFSHSHASTGVSGTNANLPPYVTVYIWKRTA